MIVAILIYSFVSIVQIPFMSDFIRVRVFDIIHTIYLFVIHTILAQVNGTQDALW